MVNLSNRITTLFDFDTSGGTRSLGQLRTELRNTEGFTNKVKVGAKGMGDMLRAHAAEGALAAAGALATFAIKGVQDFADLGVAAGKFADATGLAVEDASRWIEVAGDVGVSAETMQGVFLRLNKAIGDGSPVLKQYGIEAQRTADGQLDVNATMLEAIRRVGQIPDATERATAAQKLFGRSYAEAAEIVFASADDIAKKLGEVSDAKVINEEELEKAREFRAMMDQLQDSIQDMSLAVGQFLVPVLKDAADAISGVDNALKDTTGGAGDLETMLKGGLGFALGGTKGMADKLTESLRENAEANAEAEAATIDLADADKAATAAANETRAATEDQTEAFVDLTDKAANVRDALSEKERFELRAARAAEEHERAIDRVTRAYERMSDQLSDRSAFLDAEDAFEELADTSDKTMRDIERDQIAAKQAVIDYAEEIGNIPPQVTTDILALMDDGKYQEALAKLRELERERTMRLKVTVLGSGVVVDENGNVRQGNRAQSPGSQQFPDDGPTGLQGAFVAPRSPQGSGGVTVIVQGSLIHENQLGRIIDEALTRHKRASGSLNFMR